MRKRRVGDYFGRSARSVGLPVHENVPVRAVERSGSGLSRRHGRRSVAAARMTFNLH